MLSLRLRSHLPTPAPNPAGPVISALVHGLLIAAAVLGPTAAVVIAENEGMLPEGLRFLLPTSASPAATQAQVTFEQSGGDGGDVQDGVESDQGGRRAGARNASTSDNAAATVASGSDAFSAGGADELANVFQIVEVDSAAEREPDSVAPIYPPALMSAGVEGWAAVQFVVDTLGRVDLSTVKSVGFTSPEFHRAVRDALPQMRFRPARIGGKPVRQLAEQLFRFEIIRRDSLP